jgi:hypothetical protein
MTRHRVKKISIHRNAVGFTLITKSGRSFLGFSSTAQIAHTRRKLSKQAPHLKHIWGTGNFDPQEFVGHYIYGRSVIHVYDGMEFTLID